MVLLMLLLTRISLCPFYFISCLSLHTWALLPLASPLSWMRQADDALYVCGWFFVTGSSPIKSHPKNECKQTKQWLLPFTTGNKSQTLRSSIRLNIQLRVSSSCLWLSHRPLTAPDQCLILQCEGNTSCCNHTSTLRWFARAVFQTGK